MWKFWQYQPLILLEAYQELNKWDKVIKQQDYANWKHHLASPSQVSADTASAQIASADVASPSQCNPSQCNKYPAIQSVKP
jgi:hypothetical protein